MKYKVLLTVSKVVEVESSNWDDAIDSAIESVEDDDNIMRVHAIPFSEKEVWL